MTSSEGVGAWACGMVRGRGHNAKVKLSRSMRVDFFQQKFIIVIITLIKLYPCHRNYTAYCMIREAGHRKFYI